MANLYGILDHDTDRRGNDRRQLTTTARHDIDSTLKTWSTTVKTNLDKDGSGYITIQRGSERIHLHWSAEQTITKGLDLTTGELSPELIYNPVATDHRSAVYYQPSQPAASQATTGRAGK